MLQLKQIGSNMTELEVNGMIILFSYQTPVACFKCGEQPLKTNKKWSVTTSKHINKWVRDNTLLDVKEVDQEYFNNLIKDI